LNKNAQEMGEMAFFDHSPSRSLGRWRWRDRGVGGSLGDVTAPTTSRILSIYDNVGFVVAVTSHTELISPPHRHDQPRMMLVADVCRGLRLIVVFDGVQAK
jgi:hypothetical protein